MWTGSEGAEFERSRNSEAGPLSGRSTESAKFLPNEEMKAFNKRECLTTLVVDKGEGDWFNGVDLRGQRFVIPKKKLLRRVSGS